MHYQSLSYPGRQPVSNFSIRKPVRQTYLVYHKDNSTEWATGNGNTIIQWEKDNSYEFSHNQLDWKFVKLYWSILFSNWVKTMPRPRIEPRNFDLQAQCFTIKLSRPTTSIFSLRKPVMEIHLVYHKDNSTEWATGSRNTIIQWEKYYWCFRFLWLILLNCLYDRLDVSA